MNDVALVSEVDGSPVTWRLSQFATPSGWVMIHPTLLTKLSELRVELSRRYPGYEVDIIEATRDVHMRQLCALRKGGYLDQGGEAPRISYHNPEFGGIAADIVAIETATGKRMELAVLAAVAGKVFPHCYLRPTHVHVDVRDALDIED